MEPSNLYVIETSYIVYHSYDDNDDNDDDYRSWEESRDSDVDSVHLTNPENRSWDFIPFNVDFEVKLHDFVYVVYVIYSSGDTFGHSEGNIHTVGVYNSPEKAQEIIDKIEDGTYTNDDSNRTGWGKYIPWDGYFESITRVSMKCLRVEK